MLAALAWLGRVEIAICSLGIEIAPIVHNYRTNQGLVLQFIVINNKYML
jgi:hypothetical protein